MPLRGWWKFHREMVEHPVWSLPDGQFRVWISILNLANHEPREWWNGTERVLIPAGSLIISQEHLATYSRTTRKTVRLSINNLVGMGSVRANIRANRYTQIDLINAETYRGAGIDEGQVPVPVRGQPRANQGPTKGHNGRSREGKKERKELPCEAGASPDVSREVLNWLNEKAEKNFRPSKTNLDFIQCRLRDKILPEQLKAIVSRKVREWKGTEREKYLRPATLFNREKCEQYLGELPKIEEVPSAETMPGV